MSDRTAAAIPRTRRGFLEADGVLLVTRAPPDPGPPSPGQPPAVRADPTEGDEILLAIWHDGRIVALHGHVDLGTGIRTALAQIVAEELEVPVAAVQVVLGDTARVPNQGPTIASASLQIHGEPLRRAAAQARAWLLRDATRADDGAAAAIGTTAAAAGLAGRRIVLKLDPAAPVKAPADYRVVGTRVARVDIPAKATGEPVFVHDQRLPGMLHGRVVRPPYAGADHGDFIGRTLESVDETSIAHVPGVRAVVVIGDFVGVVAEREEHAEQAAAELAVRWKPWPALPQTDDIVAALRANPATPRRLVDDGDVDAALANAGEPLERTYLWPYQMHASIGPSCAVAQWYGDGQDDDDGGRGGDDGRGSDGDRRDDRKGDGGRTDAPFRLTVWAGTQNPHALRADLALLVGVAPPQVEVVRLEASGCYGRNGADDVAADAALLSRAVGAPVRVQLTRAQEHQWEPKGAAQTMTVRGGVDADGGIAGWDFTTAYPSNAAPTLALLLTRTVEPLAQAFEMGDRTARPPYAVADLRVTVNDMPPILRASWLRGVSALPNSFAHESFIDELATAAGADPIAFRLRHLPDPRARELLQATAAHAGWKPHERPQQQSADGDRLRGQGVAYARYVHSKWPGFGAAWSAWIADVEVDRRTGDVHVERVVVGHDAGLMVNPAGIEHQVHGNVLQTTSRALKERVSTDPASHIVTNREWGSYPILSFREVPVIEVVAMPRPDQPPLGAGESSSVPGTAAIANAIFDATGVRFRQPPFTPEVIRAALNPLAGPPRRDGAAGAVATADAAAIDAAATMGATAGAAATAGVPAAAGAARAAAADVAGDAGAVAAVPGRMAARPTLPADARWPRPRRWWRRAAALAAGALGVGAALFGWRPTIAPVTRPDASMYTAAAIERGGRLAAVGNCIGCHTAPGGAPLAGGRPLETPFGMVYATNLTPDVATGIGSWSFSAFQRAMREGIARDGRHLYPAFPYPSFTRITDDDLTALYAWLMAQPAVAAATPPTRLAFPFSLRPLLALWNALHLTPGAQPVADPARSAQWNRGAYLVDGAGHCGACHTPRDATGAERNGRAYLAGAIVDGWEAPALTALSRAPVPWSEDELFRYLRRGHGEHHGVAAGPMAQVVTELAAVPDDDLRAIAHYLASFNPPLAAADAAAQAQAAVAAAQTAAATLRGPAQRMFETACSACHHDGDGPRLLGANRPLALNSVLHADTPDSLLQVILNGVREPATRELGFMPAFRDALDDRQLGALAAYLRSRFAPQRPPWTDLEAAAARVRAAAIASAAAAGTTISADALAR
ncbi:MAG: molybdopterin cofactor-binding domain-containing protein [Lautropia sp.]